MSTNSTEYQLEAVRREAALALRQVDAVLTVSNPEEEQHASAVLVTIKAGMKKVEEQRKFLTKPLVDHTRNINAQFAAIVEPFEKAVDRLSHALVAYRQSAERKEAEAYQKALEGEARKAVGAGDVAKLQEIQPILAEANVAAPKVVRTDSGSVSMREVTKWEIIDKFLVPHDFLIPDEPAINAAVKKGMQIAGIRTWKENVAVVRT